MCTSSVLQHERLAYMKLPCYLIQLPVDVYVPDVPSLLLAPMLASLSREVKNGKKMVYITLISDVVPAGQF